MSQRITPGTRCLIIAPKIVTDMAGMECTAVRFVGPGKTIGRDGLPVPAPDWWEIDLNRPLHPNGLPWAARAAWLMPLGDPDQDAGLEHKERELSPCA